MTKTQITSLIVATVIIIIALAYSAVTKENPTDSPTPMAKDTETSTDYSPTNNTSPTQKPVSGTKTNPSTPPSSSIPTTPATYELKLGQSVTVSGITATVVSVAEDSRCPVGSQCIWAGTVKVNVKLQKGTVSTTQVVELNKPLGALGFSAELIKVTPEKETGKTFPSTDYRFTFILTKS